MPHLRVPIVRAIFDAFIKQARTGEVEMYISKIQYPAMVAQSIFAFGCVTSNPKGYKETEVLERISGSDSTPDFATGAKTF